MPRRTTEDDWDDDDADWSDSEDQAEDDDTIPCPYCRRHIHEDAVRCPHCEKYLSEEDAPPARKPWWIIVGVLLCLYLVYRWLVG